MGGLQHTGGLVMLARCVAPHKSVYRPAAWQNPDAPPIHKAERCQSVRFSQVYHLITQTQVRKISVWVIFCFGQS
jgi:hypothetical protein